MLFTAVVAAADSLQLQSVEINNDEILLDARKIVSATPHYVKMPKRKQAPSSSLPSESSSDEIHEGVARELIDRQKAQQLRRRSAAQKNNPRARTSLWTCIASRQIDEDSRKYACAVCNKQIPVNANHSSSNICQHYKASHPQDERALVRLNEQNATEASMKNLIDEAASRVQHKKRKNNIASFFNQKTAASKSVASTAQRGSNNPTEVPVKLLQSVTLVLWACSSGAPLSHVGSPITQAVIDVCGGRLQFSSKEPLEDYLLPTNNAVSDLLNSSATQAEVGSVTIDGWSAALGTPVLGMTWHFIDEAWKLKCLPIAALDTGTACKSSEQLRAIVEEILKESSVVGSDRITVHTITSDNEPSMARAVDLLTNYVGSVRCIVHTLALCVNDVFQPDSPWQKYMDHVNRVTSYFNYHPKAVQLLKRKQRESGVGQDRTHYLKHDVPTRWHSRLSAMMTHICELDNITSVLDELGVTHETVPRMSKEQENTLAELINVLAEVRRVARQLEADRYITMSRAPRLTSELYETLRIMAGSLQFKAGSIYDREADAIDELDVDDDNHNCCSLTVPSLSSHCAARDAVRRGDRLRKSCAKDLAEKIAHRIKQRLGSLWEPVSPSVAQWRPVTPLVGSEHISDHEEEPQAEMRGPRRILLFHIASILDVNECELEYLQCSQRDRESYMKVLYTAVSREAMEHEANSVFDIDQLSVVFGLLHKNMRRELQSTSRKEPETTLDYWRKCNSEVSAVSPLPFNKVIRAALSSQASSASAERLFSDLGRTEGRQRQTSLTSTLEMTELVRNYVNTELRGLQMPQTGLLHPRAFAFKRLARHVACRVVEMQ